MRMDVFGILVAAFSMWKEALIILALAFSMWKEALIILALAFSMWKEALIILAAAFFIWREAFGISRQLVICKNPSRPARTITDEAMVGKSHEPLGAISPQPRASCEFMCGPHLLLPRLNLPSMAAPEGLCTHERIRGHEYSENGFALARQWWGREFGGNYRRLRLALPTTSTRVGALSTRKAISSNSAGVAV